MYYKRKSNTIYRNYGSFGYITDNRNFGYKAFNDHTEDIGDKIVSQSGAIFLEALSRKPQPLETIIDKIALQFPNVDRRELANDAEAFFALLETDGFIVSGKTVQECYVQDIIHFYENESKKKERQRLQKAEGTDTQDYLDKIFHGHPQLTSIHMEITSQCNERCIHCYIPHENKIHEMAPDLFYNILEQCRKMNLLHITISGGEPLLHSEIIGFLRKCNEYNFSVNVLSNLTILTDSIRTEMQRNPLLSVQTSLYSMDKDIHDSITQLNGSFEKTKGGILQLVESNIPIQISCPILKSNMFCYTDVINWGHCHNINVNSDHVIIAKYDHTTQNLYSRLSVNDVQQILQEKVSSDPKYLATILKEASNKGNINPADYVCSVCHSSICISESGSVYPCPGWQNYVVGNVKDTPLEEIWFNSEKVQFLRGLRKQDFQECLQCPDYKYCTMCMVRNANENPSGSPLIVNDHYCKIAKATKYIVSQACSHHLE